MNKQTLILIIVIALILIPTGVAVKLYSADQFEIMNYEAGTAYCVAFASTSKKSQVPPPKPTKTLCNACKGNKTVLTPDGITRIPCECGANCKCKSSGAESSNTTILVFGSKSCVWCRHWEKKDEVNLKKNGWTFGENKNIQKIDVDENRKLMEKYDISLLPTYVVIKDGKEIKRIVGYVSGRGFLRLYNGQDLLPDDQSTK